MSPAKPSRPGSRPPRDPLVYAAPLLILIALLILGAMMWLASPAPSVPTAPPDSDKADRSIESEAPDAGTPPDEPDKAATALPGAASSDARSPGFDPDTLPADASLQQILDATLAAAEAGDAQAACVAGAALGRCRARSVHRFGSGTDERWSAQLARQSALDDDAIDRLDRARTLARRVREECRSLEPELRRREPALLWQSGRAGHVPSLRALLDPRLIRRDDLVADPALVALLQQALPAAFEILLQRGDPELASLWALALGDSAEPAMLRGRPSDWYDPEIAAALARRVAAASARRPPSMVSIGRDEQGRITMLERGSEPSSTADQLFDRYFSRSAASASPQVDAPPTPVPPDLPDDQDPLLRGPTGDCNDSTLWNPSP